MQRVGHCVLGRVGTEIGRGLRRPEVGGGTAGSFPRVLERGVRRAHVPTAVAAHGHDEGRQARIRREPSELDLPLRVARPGMTDRVLQQLRHRRRVGARRELATRDRDLGVAIGQRLGGELQVIDRQVDTGERCTRILDELQVGGAVRHVVDRLAHRAHLGR